MPFYKLRDTGTSYHNVHQQVTIVGNRVEELNADEHVFRAVREKRLIQVEAEDEIAEAQANQRAYDEQLNKRAALVNAATTDAGKVAAVAATPIDPVKEPATDKPAPIDHTDPERIKLEAAYKEATGQDAPENMDNETLINSTAASEASKDATGKGKGKGASLADLANESNAQ